MDVSWTQHSKIRANNLINKLKFLLEKHNPLPQFYRNILVHFLIKPHWFYIANSGRLVKDKICF